MAELMLHRETKTAIALPQPRMCAVAVRQATLKDIPFIDGLQRKHAKAVGWFPRGQIEGCIKANNIVIAEDDKGIPLGYCIAKDKYLKQDQLGICYQLNVVPDQQRGLIGATLLKAVFDRSAYGCKLFCCWCAQDLQANHFWESMGFIALAFRTGSRKFGRAGAKKTPRIHIFWQRRIREGDTETPYWFPSETSGGALKENRLVLPIPPGTHWSDAKPAILPGMENVNCGGVNVLPPGAQDNSGGVKALRVKKPKTPVALMKPKSIKLGGLRTFKPTAAQVAQEKKDKPREKPIRFKNDPKMVAAARELRDRYMEQVNVDPSALLPPSAYGKYEVSRQLEGAPTTMKVAPAPEIALLEAA